MSKRGRCEEEPPKNVFPKLESKPEIFRIRIWKTYGDGKYVYVGTYLKGAEIYFKETVDGLKFSLGVMNVIITI